MEFFNTVHLFFYHTHFHPDDFFHAVLTVRMDPASLIIRGVKKMEIFDFDYKPRLVQMEICKK